MGMKRSKMGWMGFFPRLSMGWDISEASFEVFQSKKKKNVGEIIHGWIIEKHAGEHRLIFPG